MSLYTLILNLAVVTICLTQSNSLASNLNNFLFKGDHKTDSILILKNNKLLIERYERGYKKETKHIQWSVSKSFTNAIAAIAIKEKEIHLNQSICDFYNNLTHDKCSIKIKHLLNYTAGLEWNEKYDIQNVLNSDVIQVIYGKGFSDTAKYALSKKLLYTPGDVLQYNTGTPNIIMDILKRVYKKRYDSLVNKFFLSIGSKNFHWAKDASGTFIGGSNLYTNSRTMLNFGKLYLNNGQVGLRNIFPKDWIKFTTTRPSTTHIIAHEDIPGQDIVESLGALFWLNKPVNGKTPWPDAPSDTFIAWGHWGQFIIIIPSLEMVIVRTGQDKKSLFDINEFIKLSIQFTKGK